MPKSGALSAQLPLPSMAACITRVPVKRCDVAPQYSQVASTASRSAAPPASVHSRRFEELEYDEFNFPRRRKDPHVKQRCRQAGGSGGVSRGGSEFVSA